ncbi:4-hydroxy-tetrahydrodipicolinate reductase [Brevibacterium atlanticum]|uniref:4-hydroxy-tetrahydrodipicolinate reductase n=1 Tax=Brevibacterium atlanticum TaxID=2697563 RepID=UPI0014219B7D|nr:4-hydroxy-tetrahydrodipicolinate reductase [Brevibacterium atlanticum]
MSIRVAVIGAKGRMGSHAVDAIENADGLELVAALGSNDSLESLLEKNIDVAVELTVPKSTEGNVNFLVEHDIDTVVGTTGWDNDRLARLDSTLKNHPETAVLIAPNFSIGAVLAMRFAELAAPYFDSAEVVETHHTRKLDAPSGTANHTAQRIAAARNSAGLPAVPDSTESDPLGARGAVIDGIHVHAIRQQGMNAHEEIHFGSDGEALTIRTDSHSTSAFMPGIVTAVRSIADYTGLIHGLENMLDL